MNQINVNFLKLPGSYLFTETARRIAAWEERNPGARLVRLGIGDATLPIPGAAAEAMADAAMGMATQDGFRGYGPEQGYGFLRQAVSEHEYKARGVDIEADEVFVSDGAKSDCGGILELFGPDVRIGLCDPVYPAYADAAAITGRAGEYDTALGRWSDLCYLPCTEENGFVPEPPGNRADLVYLCFPNNPTGAAATREQLAQWVNWANASGAVLLYDGAYEAYITDHTLPHSIFEIKGAKTCAVEFRSFSKTAGFTGVRCGYTVIPKALRRDGASLHALWKRRQAARFNGVSYIVQRGAAAIYTEAGQKQVAECIAQYQKNAGILRDGLLDAGFSVFGGVNAPYIWVKIPGNIVSWDYFDWLLQTCAIAATPGGGFGPHGEGYIRLTAFCSKHDAEEAVRRIQNAI